MASLRVPFREWFDRVRRGELPGPPIARLLGFEVIRAADGEATAVIEADDRLAHPMGTLHGGVICDITDAAMGCAIASILELGQSFTTIELKANFFKPIWKCASRGARTHRASDALAGLPRGRRGRRGGDPRRPRLQHVHGPAWRRRRGPMRGTGDIFEEVT